MTWRLGPAAPSSPGTTLARHDERAKPRRQRQHLHLSPAATPTIGVLEPATHHAASVAVPRSAAAAAAQRLAHPAALSEARAGVVISAEHVATRLEWPCSHWRDERRRHVRSSARGHPTRETRVALALACECERRRKRHASADTVAW